MHESTAGSKRQYNAVSFQIDKRMSGAYSWLGGRYSYTWSNSKDNQWGENSVYAWRTNFPQNNYDLNAEYATSIYNSPHRIILAPIVRLPGPADHSSAKYTLLGGWNASAIIELVSGSPLNAVISSGTSADDLGLLGGQQRPNLIGDPNTTGSDEDRVASAAHPDARFFNAGAFQNPGPGQYGNAPRTIDSALTQFRKNIDLVFSKDTKLGGNQVGEIRFEILNLTNTPKFGNESTNNAINTSSFGRIATQAGFMRIWQLTFRYRF
jgi:trimeric autotransporter adhesin